MQQRIAQQPGRSGPKPQDFKFTMEAANDFQDEDLEAQGDRDHLLNNTENEGIRG